MPSINTLDLATALYNKIINEVKSLKGIHFGDTELTKMENGNFCIGIETSEPQTIGHFVVDMVRKDTRAQDRGFQAHNGQYDWKAQVYMKDTVLVYFKF